MSDTGPTLITGATGYIGQKLAYHLAGQGLKVHLLVRNAAQRNLPSHQNISIFEGDVQDPGSVQKAIHGCTQVYHVAGLARLIHKDPSVFYRVNVDGTKNLLEAAKAEGVRKFIYTSTTGVIGPSLNQPMRECDPRTIGYDNDYETSKELAEHLVVQFSSNGLEGVIVSPSRVYGPGLSTYSSGVNRFIQGYLKKGFAVVPICDHVYGNYAYIDDVIAGHILAMEKGRNGERYILGGENVSFGSLMQAIRHESRRGRFIRIPKSIIKTAALGSQMKAMVLRQTPELTPRMVDRLFLSCAFSSDKAIRELGYSITPFTEGIRKTISHIKNGTA
jgi:nucleoside-diphosphate-sugar epimerase